MGFRGMKERYAAEALGTFLIVFFGVGAPAINIISDGQLGAVGISLATGFAVLIVCYSLGHVSGAHVNPAVTIAFATQKKFPMKYVIPYILSQVAGAVAACMAIYLLFGNISSFAMGFPVYSWQLVFLIEFLITFTLMFVIMGVATDSRAADPAAAGLPIGATVTLNTLFSFWITGAMMNPARAIAPAIVLGDFSWQWVYWPAILLGAIFGAWAYERVRSGEAPKFEEFGVLGPINK
ncbi:MAG: aquaporin [Candidatus Micrarchaeota archaeon]